MKRHCFSNENLKEKYILNVNKTLYIARGQKNLFRSLIDIEFQFYGSNFVFSVGTVCVFGRVYLRHDRTSFKMV